MFFIANVLSRHVHGWTLGLGSILHSGEFILGDSWQLFSEGKLLPQGFCRGEEQCLQIAESAYPQAALLRPCSQMAYPSQWVLRELSVHSQAFSSFPWWMFSAFKGHLYLNQWKVEFLWTLRHLRSSSQEDCCSGKKEMEVGYLQSSSAKSHLQNVISLFERKRKLWEAG